ncbi:MAG: DUF2799 domain-containing protein [Burkholderiales bacterium]
MKFLGMPALALLTACASLDAAQCRNAYDVGFRDAIFGLQRQDNAYERACSRNGVQLDSARYVEGWREGKREFDQRTIHGGAE